MFPVTPSEFPRNSGVLPTVVEDNADFTLALCTQSCRGVTESKLKTPWQLCSQYNFDRNDEAVLRMQQQFPDNESYIEMVDGHPVLGFHDPYLHACYKLHGVGSVRAMFKQNVRRMRDLRTGKRIQEGYIMDMRCCADRLPTIGWGMPIIFKTNDESRAVAFRANVVECQHFRSLHAHLLWKRTYKKHRTTIAALGAMLGNYAEVTLRPGHQGFVAVAAHFAQCVQETGEA